MLRLIKKCVEAADGYVVAHAHGQVVFFIFVIYSVLRQKVHRKDAR